METLVEIDEGLLKDLGAEKEKAVSENKSELDLSFKEGTRNSGIFRVISNLRSLGFSERQISSLIRPLNQLLCVPRLSHSELKKLSTNVGRYSQGLIEEADPIQFWSLRSFMTDPNFKEPVPVVEGIFHLCEFHIISAPAKAGKSILMLNLALSLAKGELFLEKLKTYEYKVLYLQTEVGNFQLRKRIDLSIGSTLESYPENLIIASERLKLNKPSGINRLKSFISEHEFKVVILDPFYTLHNSNEDSSSEMAPLLSDLRQLALDLNILIILVHHQGKRREEDGQTGHKHRGSSSFADVPDGNISLRRTSKDTAVLDFELRNVESPPSMNLILKGLNWTFSGNKNPERKFSTSDIRDFLASNGEMSYSDLAKALADEFGVSSRLVKSKISTAVELGAIEKRKDGKSSIYSIPGADIEIDFSASLHVLNNNHTSYIKGE